MTRTKKKAPPQVRFIETMECLPVTQLPKGPEWSYEIKLDGFRLEAVKQNSTTTLFSRRRNILNRKFHYVVTALEKLPDNTVLDGEIVALNPEGKSDFGLLQNFRSAEIKIHYYVFDVLILRGKDVSQQPLKDRRALLSKILPRNNHISESAVESGSYAKLLKFVEQHGLEGIVPEAGAPPWLSAMVLRPRARIAPTSPGSDPAYGRSIA
jgi:ATP-dependent DNA ligase